ncbi:MAG: tyrosine-protein kinase Etk/Wzc, partial [Bacteroidales bacterium]|nr:tyrosine-protein kinase Etk/Wzc [Bacteroidales bacterium]
MENFQSYQQEETIDLKALFFKFTRFWYLFAISIFIALLVAFLFNKYTKPVYEVKTSVLVKDDKTKMDPSALLGGLGLSTQQNLQNEIGILMSYSLSDRVVKSLDFEVSYFEEDGFVKKELYLNAPFTVEVDFNKDQAVNLPYSLKINDNGTYTLAAEGENISQYDYKTGKPLAGAKEKVNWSGSFSFGEWVDNEHNRFRIVLNEKYDPEVHNTTNLSFTLNDYQSLLRTLRGFTIEPINREASILEISLKGNIKEKSADFLNRLTSLYLQRGLDKKNQIAENTIEFIDQQLVDIQDSLSKAEIDLQDFQTSNELMNIDFQSQQVFEYLKELEQQKAELMVKSKYYRSLQNYIQVNLDELDKLVAPSAMGIEDPLLNRLVQELVNLSAAKAEQMLSSTEKHPTVVSIDMQIVNTKKTLLENINNIILNSDMAMNNLDNRISALEQELNKLPSTQRLLLGYQRKFQLNDAIYTFLMQKRAEAQITKASNLADNEILDRAEATLSAQVFPKKSLNYTIALLLGLLIPVGYILGRDYLNDKLVDRKEIEIITKLPIVGQVLHNNKETQLVVADSPKSSISESFRSVRTNIEYLVQGKEKSIILVTSDMVSAGKTFVSINLASIYAMYGKKTVLLGFDLRKPKIYQDFGLSNSNGLSSYLINKNSLDEIIQPSGKVENFDLIMAGPVPPNPAELIASEKCKTLFDELRERYDYIIIDTPPVGLVTDAFLLMKHTDVNLFIVRQNYTHKKIFESIIKDIEDRNIPMNILVNDIRMGGGYGYG